MVANGDTPFAHGANGTNGTNGTAGMAGAAGVTRAEFPIAIVGMSCRFSGGVTSPSGLWELCAAGKDGWSPIPADRFHTEAWYSENPRTPGRTNVRSGYFLQEDLGLFDAAFFKLTGDLAHSFDPQVRLLLEAVYEATEDAGIPIESLAGSDTSVFTGHFSKDYYETRARDVDVLKDAIPGTGTALMANRLSYFYDWRGASMAIDTGCSASMVALHQACQTLWSGDSGTSVVAGVNALLNPDQFIAMTGLGALSPDGRCYGWDSRANGYARGEGVGVLLLKPLAAAVAAGDRVHGVVRASGLNHDGKTVTISSPNMDAQVDLIREVYRKTGLDLADTGYVEAHMTGTPVGDPTEAEALARTFGRSRTAEDPVLVGSAKPNIGHTEPVSGIASIIKTCYALRHGRIPPNLNYDVTHPKIPLDEWHMRVPRALTPWPANKPFRASINNFGYGGANAHVILERPPTLSARHENGTNGHGTETDRSFVYVLSAKDSGVVKTMAGQFAEHVAKRTDVSLSDLAYTLAERRSRLPWVVAVPARSIDDLCGRWTSPATKPLNAELRPVSRLGFVFNGQGAQWHAMGRELVAYPVFAARLHEASSILKDFGAGWSLYDELQRDKATTRVHAVDISQPAAVALQLCLVDLLAAWGVRPAAVTSHSSGEIAAAYAVGALTFREALGVIFHRGQLAKQLQETGQVDGAMAAVGLGPEAVAPYLEGVDGHVLVACINSGDSVTLSGDAAALDGVVARLTDDGVFARRLKVPLAYHSAHMGHIAQEYAQTLQALLPNTPKAWESVVFASPVTGDVVTSAKTLSPGHWARNLTSPVQFSQAFDRITGSIDMVVEIGAHSTLAGPIRQILKASGVELPYGSCLTRGTNAVDTVQELACALVGRGYPVDLGAVNFPQGSSSQTTGFVADLPTYPWNHKTRYWDEPRLSREMRERTTPPHALLGVRTTGQTSATHTWRNTLRLGDELEWLRDHQVEHKAVVPGAAYVSTAIEAAKQLAEGSSIRGYRLRDVEILKALVVPELPASVETLTTLRPASSRELEHDGWWEFSLTSLDHGGFWAENSRGFVRAEVGAAPVVDTTRTVDPPEAKTFLPESADVSIPGLFDALHKAGIQHGPAFRNLTSSRASPSGRGVTDFVVGAAATPDYVLHPTTLDSVFQAAFCCLPAAGGAPTMSLPRTIGGLFVPTGLGGRAGAPLQAFTQLVKQSRKGIAANISVTDADSAEFLQMTDFFCQTVPRDEEGTTEVPNLCTKSDWHVDVSFRVPDAIKAAMQVATSESEIDEVHKLTRASVYFAHDALTELADADPAAWAGHHRLFFSWMQDTVARAEAGSLGAGSAAWTQATRGIRRRLYDELHAGNSTDRLLARVGTHLSAILRGEVTPLELMMEDNLLNDYYALDPAFLRLCAHAGQLATRCAIQCPGARVLEIGAGTGTWTQTVLEAFDAAAEEAGLPGTLLGHYTYTDISQGFFAAAKDKFASRAGRMDFAALDISADPAAQGFAPGSYDLVVAAMVLHATPNLATTLANVRALLRPGGRLLLFESTRDRVDRYVVFGPLPGWWLGEEPDRKTTPHVSLRRWDTLLREAGFSGVEFAVDDYLEPDLQSGSTIMATAVDTAPLPAPVAVVYAGDELPPAWTEQLCSAIAAQTGTQPTVESLQTVDARDKIVIFTPELVHPFVDGLDADRFDVLRRLVLTCHGVLWLSAGGLVTVDEPAYAATQGLLRTLRMEDVGRRYIHLDFSPSDNPWTEDKIAPIIHVLQQSFRPIDAATGLDNEYAVRDGHLHVARLVPDTALSRVCDEDASAAAAPPVPTLEPFRQPGRPLVWETAASGLLADLHFTDKLDLLEPLPTDAVEVEAHALGVNFRDLLVALGQLEEDYIAHESAGIVTQIGPEAAAASGLRVGDRVCSLADGRYASRSRAHWTAVAPIPDGLSFAWAATAPVAYATAYHGLFHIAHLQAGESVLVHAAAGGFGQAAMVLAQHAGAVVYATCSSAAKRDLLVREYGLPPEHILSSRDASFAPAIMGLTGGEGVDVVLNSLAGPLLKATWDCIARFGRFVEVGKIDMEAARRLDMTPFRRGALFAGVDLLQLKAHRGPRLHEALVESLRICDARARAPIVPITEYPMTQVEDALRLMQTGRHVGKLVLVPGETDKVKVVARHPPVALDSDATYLVVGGVTGIGSVVARWMMARGAKHLLLVSRHATTHANAPGLVADGTRIGCQVHIRDCDVADAAALAQLVAATTPPIRGVVNGAMVLADTILEHMTFDQWTRAVRPKIDGSRNLHRLLPDVAFFIMLSSVLGVGGGTSQANYAAGNTYEDALARHRAQRGLPATTIDLCVIRNAGYVESQVESGDAGVITRTSKIGVRSVDVDAVLRLLEEAVRHPRPAPPDSQLIMGVTDDTIGALERHLNVPRDRRFGTLRLAVPAATGGAAGTSGGGAASASSTAALVQTLTAAASVTAAAGYLAEALATKLADMFALPLADIDPALPLARYGVDSLVAVELRNWLSSAIKAKVSVFEIVQSTSLLEFSQLLATKSDYVKV